MSTRRRVTAKMTVSGDRGVFMISVAAELAEMHPQTLRMYEQRGLVEPKRSPKGTRLYSLRDVERLRRIQEMTADSGLNLAGVERVLELEEQLERTRRRADQLQHELDVTKTKLDEAERRLKGEVVPYRRGEVIPVRQQGRR
jgi:MerR family transcriptional regulator/heat shock protein HspR